MSSISDETHAFRSLARWMAPLLWGFICFFLLTLAVRSSLGWSPNPFSGFVVFGMVLSLALLAGWLHRRAAESWSLEQEILNSGGTLIPVLLVGLLTVTNSSVFSVVMTMVGLLAAGLWQVFQAGNQFDPALHPHVSSSTTTLHKPDPVGAGRITSSSANLLTEHTSTLPDSPSPATSTTTTDESAPEAPEPLQTEEFQTEPPVSPDVQSLATTSTAKEEAPTPIPLAPIPLASLPEESETSSETESLEGKTAAESVSSAALSSSETIFNDPFVEEQVADVNLLDATIESPPSDADTRIIDIPEDLHRHAEPPSAAPAESNGLLDDSCCSETDRSYDLFAEQTEWVIQQFRRTRRPSGCEAIEGYMKIDWQPAQKRQVVHVPFYPPFMETPEIYCEPADESDVRLKVAECRRYGARIELTLARPASKGQTTCLHLLACLEKEDAEGEPDDSALVSPGDASDNSASEQGVA